MVFSIVLFLVTLLYLVLLELSKNMIIGWLVGIFAAVIFFLERYTLKKQGITTTKIKVISWCSFCLILFINYFFSAPPYKNVPAVDIKDPQITNVVQVEQGDLRGVYNEDKSVRVFAGIPYAAPPIGELRFKEPQAPENWEGIRECDEFGPMAMQPRSFPLWDSITHILGWHDYRVKFGDEYLEAMSEDCLYLNVWAPEEDEELKPVVIYIHGGSLTTGQSSYVEYRGEDFAKQGVVFVDFAYRLGVFGYYTADDLKAESLNGTTGNYGLLDQIAAVKWVHDNIESFGGDPNQITIAGESAGSSSVNALCVSPLSEGLFKYAIAQSSGILAVEPFHTFRSYDEAVEEGQKVRDKFKVKTSEELRKISAYKLLKHGSDQSAMTVDGYAIIEQPYLTYEKGNNHEQALLNGFNAKEADAFLLETKATSENYKELLSEEIGEQADEMAEVVPTDTPQRDQHFIVDAMGDAKGALNEAYSAIWFSYSHYVWNKYLIKQGVPTYEYYFTKENDVLSNYHSGEIPYAYGNLWRFPGLYDEEDYKLSEIMQKYWINFAKTGNPNGEGLPKWEKDSAAQGRVLQLDTTIKMVDDPNMEIYKVIDEYQNSLR